MKNDQEISGLEISPPTLILPARYRLAWPYFVLGIAGTLFTAGFGLFAVYSAYWNLDGSFPNPMLHALVHGIFWSGMTFLGILLIVAYFREQLLITPEDILYQGCITRRRIQSTDVEQIIWNGLPRAGRVVVRSHVDKITIHLGNYTGDEQRELIQFFHERFPLSIQDGWARFIERGRLAQIHSEKAALPNALICACLLVSFGGVLIACWIYGLGTRWLVIGILNILAGLWYFRRYQNRKKRVPGISSDSDQNSLSTAQ